MSGQPDEPADEPGGETPPHNLDAERSLIGAMLLSRDAIADAVEETEAAAFYRPAHGWVFDAVARLYAAGEGVDAVTVAAAMETETLAAVGGLAGLMGLQAGTPATSNARRYARIVDDLHLRRRIMQAAGDVYRLGRDAATGEASGALDAAEAAIFALRGRRAASASVTPIGRAMESWLDAVSADVDAGVPAGLQTGLHRLDAKLAGLRPGQFVIVGGRPAMGKTELGVHLSRTAAGQGAAVLYVSAEMTATELVERFMAQESGSEKDRLRRRALLDADWTRISRAVGRVGEWPVYVLDDPVITPGAVRSAARRLASRVGPIGLVVVDYLQLLEGDRRGGSNREERVAEVSRSMKMLAREAEAPVVALSSLSRNVETRADKRPQLSDLRESGGLEADADVVVLLYREEVYEPRTERAGLLELIVAKQRNGPTGTVRVRYDAATGRITDPSPVEAAEPLEMWAGE